MSETNKDQQRGPVIGDIHPLPGTPEAKARGCKCWVGKGADGKPLYAMTKGCPIRNHG